MPGKSLSLTRLCYNGKRTSLIPRKKPNERRAGVNFFPFLPLCLENRYGREEGEGGVSISTAHRAQRATMAKPTAANAPRALTPLLIAPLPEPVSVAVPLCAEPVPVPVVVAGAPVVPVVGAVAVGGGGVDVRVTP